MSGGLVRVGTAGWAIPAPVRDAFSGGGTNLERYARAFSCAEINSTFYRSHRATTYERWARSVPPDFRFSLKFPKTITHTARLKECTGELTRFLAETAALGEKRGPLILQFPPSFAYEDAAAAAFLEEVRERYNGDLACEPRHATWFEAQADARLQEFRVARIAADPRIVPDAGDPGGWRGLRYYRWHGSPRMYYSAYDGERLDELASQIRNQTVPVWCIFDNTAGGAGTPNALELEERL